MSDVAPAGVLLHCHPNVVPRRRDYKFNPQPRNKSPEPAHPARQLNSEHDVDERILKEV